MRTIRRAALPALLLTTMSATCAADVEVDSSSYFKDITVSAEK